MALRARPEYFEFHTSRRLLFSAIRGPLRAAPQSVRPDRLETAEGRRFAIARPACRASWKTRWWTSRARSISETGLPNLCFGGGVALNGVANQRLLPESGFERLFVPPAPGDAGCALGAALYADRVYFGNPDRQLPDHPFWGPPSKGWRPGASGRRPPGPRRARDAALIERVADDLPPAASSAGWMAPRSWDRAPSDTEASWPRRMPQRMRDRLNRDIKYREEFRPFAPVVPAEAADRYFELPPGATRLSRFMSGVFPVRPEWRARLGAVTHVDGTARASGPGTWHGSAPARPPRGHERQSGIPVLLNTSFNLSREPSSTVPRGLFDFRRSGIHLLAAAPCAGLEARGGYRRDRSKENESWVVRKRSGIRRRLIMLGTARRLDRGPHARVCGAASPRQPLAPPAGGLHVRVRRLVLILAATVEALAPFIYATF